MSDLEIYEIPYTSGLGWMAPKPEGKVWVKTDDHTILYASPKTARIIYESLKVLRRRHKI